MPENKKISDKQLVWLARLDRFSAVSGALVPTGLVVGNVGFEGMIGLAGLSWLLRILLSVAWGDPDRRYSIAVLGRHPLVLPWIVWYAVIIISLAWNDPAGGEWGYNLVLARQLVFLAAMLDISRRLPVGRYFLFGLAGGLVWAAANTLSAHLLGHDLIGKPLARYTGRLKEGSRIAHLAAFAAPFYFCRVLLTPKLTTELKRRLILLTLLSVCLVFITKSRTTILAMALGLVLPFFLRKRLLRFLVPFCLVLLIAGGWMIFQDGRMWDFSSVYHRFYIWKVSWLIWLDHPFIGVSASGFKEAFPLFASPDLVASFNLPDPTNLYWTSASHAHNLFLMVLAVSGIAGLAAFSWLLINAVRMTLRAGQDWRSGLVSWPVVFLTIGMIGTNIYDGMSLTLFAFFLVLIGDIKAV